MKSRPRLELAIEHLLFASRWLVAPFYLGMVLALVLVLVVFVRELVESFSHIATMDAEGSILLSLSLIDLSLTGNLLLIVMFSGYENFVSKIHVGEHEDRPAWMGTVDFAGLKLKLIASIVAISGIALLRAFLPLGDAGAHGLDHIEDRHSRVGLKPIRSGVSPSASCAEEAESADPVLTR